MAITTTSLGLALAELTRQLDHRAKELDLRCAIAYACNDVLMLHRCELLVATSFMDHGTWRYHQQDLTDEFLVNQVAALEFAADHLLYHAMHSPVISCSSIPSQRVGALH